MKNFAAEVNENDMECGGRRGAAAGCGATQAKGKWQRDSLRARQVSDEGTAHNMINNR